MSVERAYPASLGWHFRRNFFFFEMTGLLSPNLVEMPFSFCNECASLYLVEVMGLVIGSHFQFLKN